MEFVAEEFRNQPIMIIRKNNLKQILILLNFFYILTKKPQNILRLTFHPAT